MLYSFRPALSSFHSLLGSYCEVGFFSRPSILRALLCRGCDTALFWTSTESFFSWGTILLTCMSSAARILRRSHSIIKKSMPSLPLRWIAYKLGDRVKRWPIWRIIWAGSPADWRSIWNTIGLYFIKAVSPSIKSWLLGESGTSVGLYALSEFAIKLPLSGFPPPVAFYSSSNSW